MAASGDQTGLDRGADSFLRAIEEQTGADRRRDATFPGARQLAVALLFVALIVVALALVAGGDRGPAIVDATSLHLPLLAESLRVAAVQ